MANINLGEAVKGLGDSIVEEVKGFLRNTAASADLEKVALEIAAAATDAQVAYAVAHVAKDQAGLDAASKELGRCAEATRALVTTEKLDALAEADRVKQMAVAGFLNILLTALSKLAVAALAV